MFLSRNKKNNVYLLLHKSEVLGVKIIWACFRDDEKTFPLAYAPNEDTNQPGHPRMSNQIIRCTHEETLHPWLSKTRQV